MNKQPPDIMRLRSWCIVALVFWSILIIGFLYAFEKKEHQKTLSVAQEIARSGLNKDYIYRLWNASHGGVYVPVTDQMPPNPYLNHIPERDIITTQGKKLTLVNPAYMTRQVHELEREMYGVRGHITSLKAIRPANKPDTWERAALEQFEQGVEEVAALVTMENLPFYRVMVPLDIKEQCLKCHAHQGYTTGQIRGGISTTVPMADILISDHKFIVTYRIYHLIIFLIGLAGLLLFFRQSSRQISKRIETEKDLVRQGDHLQGIVDNISSGIAVYDVHNEGETFVIKNINLAGLKIAQLELADVQGKDVTEAFSGVIEMGLFAVLQRVWKTGVAEHFPVTVYSEDRISYWVKNYVYKLPTNEIVAVYDDVTEKKQAEETILEKTTEWEKTFNAIPDIITLQNKDMNIVRANQAALDFFNMESEEELLGTTCYQLFRGTTEPCVGCPGVASFVDEKQHSRIIEHASLNKVFRVCSAPVFDKNNEVQYFVYVAQDVTEKKRLEEELFQAHKMEAIGTLAGGIAHDFNNILSAILGYAELAKMDLPADSKAVKDIHQVITAGERATDLVKQILTFSRKTSHLKQPLRLHFIVNEALQLIRASLPSTIDIQATIAKENDMVLADPTNIHQIVVNLCTNALHAIGNKRGKIEVTLGDEYLKTTQIPASENIQAGSFLVLSVKDNGKGMDEQTAARVFEPYFTTKKEGEGTGLGLAVIHSIIEESNGFIRVKSRPDEGTTIRIYLPAIGEGVGAVTAARDTIPLPTGTETILFVDDEPTIVDISQSVLTSLGYHITTETKSLDALKKFEAAPEAFDLVITDQTMPELTGTELAEAILKLKPDTPIILCSGYPSSIIEAKVYAIGIKRFVAKPLNERKLAEIVRQVLDEQSQD